ncbi:PKD domain-containing protein [Chitinophaga sp. 30R24]|uniref:PKD domain-containing protein n=1 Tax=Chitinophaga sp. 30R24 TaxID=3248838 RepID=UPI003B8FFF01
MRENPHVYRLVKVNIILSIWLLWSLAGICQTMTPKSFNDPSISNIKGFYEYLPAGYVAGAGKKYPLILFFHGQGELVSSGSPLSGVLRNGLPQKINAGVFPASFTVNSKQYSFIVICPQFNTWPGSSDAIKFKDYLLSKYDIDTNRIYLTGLSMGGGEAWGALCENRVAAKAFAAAAIVCGYYPPTASLAAVVAGNNTPVWAFHNQIDPNVPPAYSIDWVSDINAINPAPNPPARLTIFNASGHDAWTQAYDPNYRENGMNMYEWMLQYSKDSSVQPSPPVNQPGKRITVTMSNTANGRAEIYYPDAMTTFNVKPGDTLCIPAGEYEYVHLGNLLGTSSKPIVIMNCGGQVKLGIKNQGTAAVFNVPTCRYVEISGSGDKNYEYGFDLNGTNINGLKIFGMTLGVGSSDFDVHNIYIHDGNILLQAKTLQTCAHPEYLEDAFVMKNVKLHHIKCRNSDGEGFYIGNTHYFWNDDTCTNLRSHWIENLWVYDNDLENIGADGIQIAMAKNGDNRVFNNRLVNYGMSKNEAQGYGILIGSGCSMKIYNNFVQTGFMPGITIFGSGVNEVYNNVISNIYYEGINVSDKVPDNTTPALFPPPTAYIYNNTIVATDSGKNAIKVFAYLTTLGHQVYNNLMVEKGTLYDYPGTGMYIKGAQPIKLTYSSNLCYPTAKAAGLVDSANSNFHLLAGSPAVNTGRDMSDFGLATDYDSTARPLLGTYDVGAFEVKNAVAGAPPVANAGADIIVQLPQSTAQLDGSASKDPDGSIVMWEWKKTAGPDGGILSAPNAAVTQVSALQTGTYTFMLTVTDNEGAIGTATVNVIVRPVPGNTAPVAIVTADTQVQLPTSYITADGSASYDPDGTIVHYQWEQVSGAANAFIATPAAQKTLITKLEVPGVYIFRLTVTDDKQVIGTASFTVVVLPESADHVNDSIAVSPNPITTTARLTVVLEGDNTVDVRIYDLLGRQVWESVYTFSNTMQTDIDVRDLPNGIYFLRVENKQFKRIKRFVKVWR